MMSERVRGNAPCVLIIEDDPVMLQALQALLGAEGYQVVCAASAEEGLPLFSHLAPAAVLLDQHLPGKSGLDALREMMVLQPSARVIMLTGTGSEDLAVAAMQLGASDYLAKPFDPAQLLASLKALVAVAALETLQRRCDSPRLRLVSRNPVHPEARIVNASDRCGEITGDSVAAAQLRARLARIADAIVRQDDAISSPVLLTGERGVGKAFAARVLLREAGMSALPLATLHCAGCSGSMLREQLSGPIRYLLAAPRAAAVGDEIPLQGALLMRDVGTLDAMGQAVLFELLQGRWPRAWPHVVSVLDASRVRIIATTSRDLQAEVRAGRFREDLYHRLNVIRVRIPPLRERDGDARALAAKFAHRNASLFGTDQSLTEVLLARLAHLDWPGNVAELKSVVDANLGAAGQGFAAPDRIASA